MQQYAGHERSEESIEAAFEKLLMASFIQRRKTKINLKSKLKKKVEESPPWVKNLLNFVELPPPEIILRRLFLFAFMGGWSIMNSAETGPAFQVCFEFLFFFLFPLLFGVYLNAFFRIKLYFFRKKNFIDFIFYKYLDSEAPRF